MCLIGDCFVVFPPNCSANSIIFGRNTHGDTGESVEVYYYDASLVTEGNCDGGAEPEVVGDELRIILQKPHHGVWGGDCGANEFVTLGITWTHQEAGIDSGHLLATDIVRLVLATATSAEKAVERIGALVAAHGAEDAKFNFVAVDSVSLEAWHISCCGKLWAAQRLTEGCHRLPSNGLSVTKNFDKSSEGLVDALKALGLWDGEGEFDFSACCGASAGSDNAWCGDEPTGDGSYSLTNMFDTLRAAPNVATSCSATVSVMTVGGISCHWFTATPNTSESVFKPFVFAPTPRISPLTKVLEDNTNTLLYKLHAQRKPSAVDDLKALEADCVDEVNNYLSEHPVADDELDELMKDCVEAEVKFYR